MFLFVYFLFLHQLLYVLQVNIRIVCLNKTIQIIMIVIRTNKPQISFGMLIREIFKDLLNSVNFLHVAE